MIGGIGPKQATSFTFHPLPSPRRVKEVKSLIYYIYSIIYILIYYFILLSLLSPGVSNFSFLDPRMCTRATGVKEERVNLL